MLNDEKVVWFSQFCKNIIFVFVFVFVLAHDRILRRNWNESVTEVSATTTSNLLGKSGGIFFIDI